MTTKNHNICLNPSKEDELKAWEKFHSKEVEQMFKSKNSFVLQAINYYYDRCIKIENDPYLETREKEDAFVSASMQNENNSKVDTTESDVDVEENEFVDFNMF